MYVFTPIGDEMDQDLSAVKTYNLPPGANGFMIQALTQNVRIRFSADPTTTKGGQIKAGDPMRFLAVGGSGGFKALQEAATAYFYCQPGRMDWVEP